MALIASVDPEQMPKATSLLYTFRSVGTTNGIALSSSFQQGESKEGRLACYCCEKAEPIANLVFTMTPILLTSHAPFVSDSCVCEEYAGGFAE